MATVLAALLAIFSAAVGPPGTDVAAQVARAAFFRAHGLTTVDLSWYGGVHPLAYSVLSPPVMALLGVPVSGAIVAVAGAGIFGALLARWQVARPAAGAAWGAAVLVADLVSGRVTFAIGVTVGLAALLTATIPAGTGRRRVLRAGAVGVLAVATTLTSPVAGLFLGLIGVAAALCAHRRDGVLLAVGAAVPLVVVQPLFPDGGRMVDSWAVTRPVLLATAAVIMLVPRSARTVRVAAVIYAVGVYVTFLVPGTLGSNAERLALLFAGPVLISLCRVRWVVLLPVLLVVGYWQVQPGWRDLRHAGAADRPGFSTPLVRELRARAARRVEVVPLRDHAEAAYVSRAVPLARGWNRQVDVGRNRLFYRRGLDAAAYLGWLRDNGVGFVALPDAPLDWSARAEAALLRTGEVPGLHPVWADRHWRLWAVAGGPGLADAPAEVVDATSTEVVLRLPRAGEVVVRVQWSPWLRVSGGGCLAPAGRWTRLRTGHGGTFRLGGGWRPHSGSGCS